MKILRFLVITILFPLISFSQYNPLNANPGFENTGTFSNWIKTGTGTFTNPAGGGRSGARRADISGLVATYATIHNTSFGVTVPATGTNYVTVMAWGRAAATASSITIAVDAGTASDPDGAAVPGGASANVGTTYTRVSYTFLAVNGETYHPVLYARNNGTATVRWDDVLIYTSTQAAADIAAPGAPNNFTITTSGSNVTFNFTQGADAGANQSGIDGVTILKSTAAPMLNSNITLSPQVFYSTNSLIGPTVSSTFSVVYNGAPVSTFTEAVTSQAVYLIYMRDKAFNYTANSSAARLLVVNSTTANYSVANQNSNVNADGIFVAADDTLTIAGGTLALRAGTNSQIDGTIKANGRLNSGGATRITFKAGSAMVHNLTTNTAIVSATWQAGSLCSVNGTVATAPTSLNQTFSNFAWNSANQTAPITLNTAFVCNGNFSVLNSGSSQLVFPAATTYNFRGNMVLNDEVTFSNTGTYRFNGTTTQTISGTLGAVPPFGNLVIATTGAGSVLLNRSLGASNTFVINSGAVLNGGAVASSLILSGTANFTNNGTYNAGNGKVVFNANANRRINGTNATTFNRLVINNSGVAVLPDKFVSLDADATVNDLLVLQNGGIRTNNRLLSLGENAVSTGNESLSTVADELAFLNSNQTSFVALCTDAGIPVTTGGLKRLNLGSPGRTTAVGFPVGFTTPTDAATTNFSPVQLQQNSGTMDNYTVRSITADSPPGTYSGSSVDFTYNILEDVPGGSNCTLRLYWQDYMEGVVFSRTISSIVHSNGTAVDHYSTSPATSAITTLSPELWAQEGTGFTSFSPFSVTSNLNILPVLFKYVQGTWVNGFSTVQWEVTGDKEVAVYQLEKSINGASFSAISTIKSKASSVASTYQYLDRQVANGNSVFYRVVAIEKTGKKTVSNQVVIKAGHGIGGIMVSPNPVVGQHLNIQMNQLPGGRYQIRMVSADGRSVSLGSVVHQGGNAVLNISLLSRTPAGVYQLQVFSNTVSFEQKIAVY
jgi:hypothetical protein